MKKVNFLCIRKYDKHIGHFVDSLLQWFGEHGFDKGVKVGLYRYARSCFVLSGRDELYP